MKVSDVLWNLYSYYKQFIPCIEQTLQEMRKPIEKDLKVGSCYAVKRMLLWFLLPTLCDSLSVFNTELKTAQEKSTFLPLNKVKGNRHFDLKVRCVSWEAQWVGC